MQKFIAQPCDDYFGYFEIAKWDEIESQYIRIEGRYDAATARDRARQLNEEYNDEIESRENTFFYNT